MRSALDIYIRGFWGDLWGRKKRVSPPQVASVIRARETKLGEGRGEPKSPHKKKKRAYFLAFSNGFLIVFFLRYSFWSPNMFLYTIGPASNGEFLVLSLVRAHLNYVVR